MSDLRIAGCTFEAAKFAVMNWHYSKTMPAGKLIKFGVWENNKFIGTVLFGRGAVPEIGTQFKLQQTEICELVRVALTDHITPVSRIIAICLRLLRSNVGLRMVVSYADINQNHIGSIYQAGGWRYVGKAKDASGSLMLFGQQVHGRSVGAKYGTRSIVWLRENVDPLASVALTLGKHKYLYPLDAEMRKQIEPLAKPYPKRVTSIDSDATVIQTGKGGATPTVTLQT